MAKSGVWGCVGLMFMLGCVSAMRADELKVGDKAPAFKAESTDGKALTLDDFKDDKVLVVCFTCNDCPIAVAYEDRFIEFTKQYQDKDVKFVALNVNVTEDLEAMKTRAEKKKFNFPYAYDGSGKSAEAYGAKVTPHLFVLGPDRHVAYIGSFDDEMATDKVTKRFVPAAVDALLAGKQPEVTANKAFGCTIKR